MSKWVSLDPECGAYVAHDADSTILSSSGMTLVEEFPEQYVLVPNWLGWLLQITTSINGRVQSMVYRRKHQLASGEGTESKSI